jgi:hypothetical protein
LNGRNFLLLAKTKEGILWIESESDFEEMNRLESISAYLVAQSYGRKVDMNSKVVGEADVDIKEFVDAKANVDIKELVDAKVDMNADSGMTNANRPPSFPQGFFYFAFNYII